MSTTFDLSGMVDKQAVAEALGLIDSNDYFMVICNYHHNHVLPNADGSDRDETNGHVFSAAMVFDDTSEMGHEPEFSFSDLDGDLRLVLAGEIEKRASAMVKVATALRKHYEDEVRGGGQ